MVRTTCTAMVDMDMDGGEPVYGDDVDTEDTDFWFADADTDIIASPSNAQTPKPTARISTAAATVMEECVSISNLPRNLGGSDALTRDNVHRSVPWDCVQDTWRVLKNWCTTTSIKVGANRSSVA